MRHADWRREATAVITRAASVLLYDTAAWYLPGMGGFCGVMGDVMGSQKGCKPFFRLSFRLADPVKKYQVFGLDFPEKLSRKKLSRKSPFFNDVIYPDLGFRRKCRFRLTKPTARETTLGSGTYTFFLEHVNHVVENAVRYPPECAYFYPPARQRIKNNKTKIKIKQEPGGDAVG